MPVNSGQKSLEFDKKMGADFITAVPTESGIYLFKDDQGTILYVGKAKNLRRRLSQYRLAPRKKPFQKMRLIVRRASSLEYRICASEKEALLLENEMILAHKPPLNVAQAFSFLYPYLGLKREDERCFSIGYTTSPETLEQHGFELFGAFRSRMKSREAFEALAFMLAFIGHHSPGERKRYGDVAFSRIVCLRQVPTEWFERFRLFFRGESHDILSLLVGELLEKPSARQLRSDTQLHIENLQRFYKDESQKLRSALVRSSMETSKIPQETRDRLFLSLT